MRIRLRDSLVSTLVVVAGLSAAAQSPADRAPRAKDGKPDLNGIWQALNSAHWDIEAHSAAPGPVQELGASAAIPGGLGVVVDGDIPYKPEALAEKTANANNWIDRDPEIKCYLPGLPRAMYMPYPFEITQSTNKIHFAYEFTSTARTVHLDKVDGPPDDTWMGHSVGRWDGDVLVTDVTNFNDRTWLDRAGNYHSDAMKLQERFTLLSPEVIRYEVTIEDPKVFTRPWRIAMPIYRRMEPNAQLIEYRCIEFVEEFMYGSLRKQQLVKHWEGETMAIDITRKVPPGDKFYQWYGK